jgi:hypothetical protein
MWYGLKIDESYLKECNLIVNGLKLVTLDDAGKLCRDKSGEKQKMCKIVNSVRYIKKIIADGGKIETDFIEEICSRQVYKPEVVNYVLNECGVIPTSRAIVGMASEFKSSQQKIIEKYCDEHERLVSENRLLKSKLTEHENKKETSTNTDDNCQFNEHTNEHTNKSPTVLDTFGQNINTFTISNVSNMKLFGVKKGDSNIVARRKILQYLVKHELIKTQNDQSERINISKLGKCATKLVCGTCIDDLVVCLLQNPVICL